MLILLSRDFERGNAVEIGICDVVPRVFVDVDEGIVFVRLRLNDPLASLLNVSPNEDLRLVVFGRSCSICGSIAPAEQVFETSCGKRGEKEYKRVLEIHFHFITVYSIQHLHHTDSTYLPIISAVYFTEHCSSM